MHDFLSLFLQISGHVLYLGRLLSDICDKVVDLLCLRFHISHLHEERADQLVQIIDLLLLVGPGVLQVLKSALQPLEPRRMFRNGFTERIKVTLLILELLLHGRDVLLHEAVGLVDALKDAAKHLFQLRVVNFD